LPKFLKKEVAYYTCYLWRKKQAGEELCLGQTMSTISNKAATAAPPAPDKARHKFLQASKEIAERKLNREDLPERKNATQSEKRPIQNAQIENRALESFPRECSNVAFSMT
jgi:hypothetical protein